MIKPIRAINTMVIAPIIFIHVIYRFMPDAKCGGKKRINPYMALSGSRDVIIKAKEFFMPELIDDIQ